MGMNKKFFLLLFFVPAFIQAGEIRQIEILESGAYDSENRAEYEKEGCKGFNPTKTQLAHYFANAKESETNDEWINKYYSPCVASGTVTFKNGSSGEWRIHSSGLGWVNFITGKVKYFYYIDNEWED